MKISILGAGAFGFAMAKVIAENQSKNEMFIFDVNLDYIKHIKKTRRHPIFHGQTKLPINVHPVDDIKLAIVDADLIVLAIPSKFLRVALQDIKKLLKKGVVFINLAKGLEMKTNNRVSEIIKSELSELDINYEICCLSGGMIAREVTLENPLCAELACENKEVAKKIAKLLWSDYLRIETTDDLVGVELAGAFKNTIAIGAGIFDGLGYGESSKSAFVSACAKEMRGLAIAMGAKQVTYGPGSQAWFGDLMTTCFGKSRNRELGELIGKGVDVKAATDSMVKNNKSIEGYITTEVVHNLLKEYKIIAPLLNDIHNVLYKDKKSRDFVTHFIKAW
jgi:glycerol-3-phosphate dehydrogenase (NAD(P)+)